MHMSINGYNAQIVIVIPSTCVNDMFKKTTSNEHKTRDTTLKSSRLITYEDSEIQIVDNDHFFLLKHVKAVKHAIGTKYDMYGKRALKKYIVRERISETNIYFMQFNIK